MTTNEFTCEAAPAVDKPSAPAAMRVIQRIWPIAVIVIGLVLTAAWTCLLGYGIAKLIGFAIY